MSDLRQPLLLSLGIACAATLLVRPVIAVPLAYAMARRPFLGQEPGRGADHGAAGPAADGGGVSADRPARARRG